mmetsp:Transcript_24002/g.26783  ORF Transcript_24002/g.26783 Transcript_24002/m.26783 type:complete len:762 (+) Transcript_24002:241-2526(+)
MITTTTTIMKRRKIIPESKQRMQRQRRRQIMRIGRKCIHSQQLLVRVSLSLLLLGIISIAEQQETTVLVSVLVSAWTTTTITTTMTRQRSISNRNRNTAAAESSSSSSILFRQLLTKNSNRNSNSGLFAIKDTKNKEADEDLISEMDARILQSMLRDNKLDLEQTSNMKKLLERGIKKDEKEIKEEEDLKKKQAEEEDTTEYSSEAIKKLANTKFWKAFQRNAAEVFESVGIAATNQLEKAAKVVVGLGFFAWERAKQDAARALPTSASIPKPKKKQVFQINDKSSYVEPKIEEEEPPPSPAVLQRTLREEFTTPADEFSAVSAEIKKIFLLADQQVSISSQDKSKDMKNPFFAAFVERKQLSEEQSSANGGNADRSSPFFASQLSTTTTRGGNARLESAYQRKKKTQFKQEKENIAKKGTRIMSATIDTAYQVKQEMKGETNIPGYKTKQLRDSTLDLSKRLAGVAQGAAGFLGGASSFLLGNKDTDNNRTNGSNKQLPSATTGNNNNDKNGNKIKAEPVEFLDDASYFAFSSPQSRERQREQQTQQQQQPNETPEYITAEVVREEDDDGVVVVDTKDSFDFFGSTINQSKVTTDGGGTSTRSSRNSNTTPSTTNVYLDAIDTTRTTTATAGGGYVVDADDGLRQVTAEVVMDDDEDMDYASVFEQARDVDNISVEELLEEAAQQDKLENKQPNFVTKVTLRSLDVLFVVVEKGVVLVPDLVQGLQRAVIRVTESKLKDSSGSSVGWEVHASTIRGEQRY